MWHNHPFSQRNKATKRLVGLRLMGRVGQNLKKGGVRLYRGNLHKIGVSAMPKEHSHTQVLIFFDLQGIDLQLY